MNMIDLTGKTAVVTGGTNGIGAAIADRFADSGAKVVVWDLESANDSNSTRLTFEVDVSNADSVQQATQSTLSEIGRVDILVNSAGIAGPTSTVWEYPVEQWRQVQAVNLDGTFLCCRAVVPSMIEHGYGRILNIASIAGKEGNPNASAYSASKAGVIALTKSLGKELAGHDIAVNCITPATADTRILEQVSEEFIQYMLSKIPRERFVTVDEVAAMVAWLCSAENSFTTGASFDLSGGRATY